MLLLHLGYNSCKGGIEGAERSWLNSIIKIKDRSGKEVSSKFACFMFGKLKSTESITRCYAGSALSGIVTQLLINSDITLNRNESMDSNTKKINYCLKDLTPTSTRCCIGNISNLIASSIESEKDLTHAHLSLDQDQCSSYSELVSCHFWIKDSNSAFHTDYYNNKSSRVSSDTWNLDRSEMIEKN